MEAGQITASDDTHTLRKHVFLKSFQSHKAVQKSCDVEASNSVPDAGKPGIGCKMHCFMAAK